MVKKVYNADGAAKIVRQKLSSDLKCGFLFGPERTGLENDHVALADAIVEIPLNPVHCSLNLAQAVLLVGYEWYKSGLADEGAFIPTRKSEMASKQELLSFFKHLEEELDNSGYLRVKEKRPRMVRNIRNIFDRAELTEQEIRTLHGIVSDLVKYRHSKSE
jgi:tRNA/rRNA methyltransferase